MSINNKISSKEDYLIGLGIETCFHYLYKNKNIELYKSFSNGLDYKTKNDLVAKLIHIEADKISRKNPDHSMNTYQWYVLNNILSSIVKEVIVQYIVYSFQNIASVKNIQWGDNCIFKIDDRDNFIILDSQSQIRLSDVYSDQAILTPVVSCTICRENNFDLLNGFDIGSFAYQMAESVKTQIETKIHKLKEYNRQPKDGSFKIVFEGEINFIEVMKMGKSLTFEMVDRYAVGAIV